MRELAARGKTILFATHYLEEADAYADRAMLMAHGLVVADGPPPRSRRWWARARSVPRCQAPTSTRSRGCRASAAPIAAAKRWC